MKPETTMQLLKQLAKGIATQFGQNCEVVVHDLTGTNKESTIIAIENGHVSKRVVGDIPSSIVLGALKHQDHSEDKLNYMLTTEEGKILRSSTLYIRDDEGKVIGIFAINFDITQLLVAEHTIMELTKGSIRDGIKDEVDEVPQGRIPTTIEHLLDDLISQSIELVGKPVDLMNKEDKIKALQFLNDAGAFLVTKSGDKISEYFGISKYTLYNYVDIKGNKSSINEKEDN